MKKLWFVAAVIYVCFMPPIIGGIILSLVSFACLYVEINLKKLDVPKPKGAKK